MARSSRPAATASVEKRRGQARSNRPLYGAAAASVEKERARLRLAAIPIQKSDTDRKGILQERQEMAGGNLITLHPSVLLRQIVDAMDRDHDYLSVTLPTQNSWRGAICAAEGSLGDLDKPMAITPSRESRSQHLRHFAIREAQELKSMPSDPPGLPIRSAVNVESLPPAPRASGAARDRVKQAAIQSMREYLGHPYVTIRAQTVERRLALVTAKLTLECMDATRRDPICRLEPTEMIWDSDAHHALIAEDLLSSEFRDHLADPKHDIYRSGDGLRV